MPSHLPTLTLSQEEVLSQYFELRDEEIARQKSLDCQLRNELYVTLKRWRGTRRFFTGERGAWSSRFVGGRILDDNWCFLRWSWEVMNGVNCWIGLPGPRQHYFIGQAGEVGGWEEGRRVVR